MEENKGTPAGDEKQSSAAPQSPKTKSTTTAVLLADGRTAIMRPAKGLDLEKGAAIARGRATNPMALLMGVASVVTTVDGKGIPYEEILDLPIEDIFEMIGVVMGNARVPSQL